MANSKRKCKHCKEYTLAKDGVIVPAGFFCSFDHALEWQQSKRQTEFKKQARKDKQELNRRTLSWQKAQTQTAFNKMRKLEEFLWFKLKGKEPECISCGKTGMDWCCGHFKTTASRPDLRYDRINTYLQCNHYCNQNLSGNIEGHKNSRGYRQGLSERFGEAKAKEIVDYCETERKEAIWTCEQLEAMRAEFNAESRRIEKLLD